MATNTKHSGSTHAELEKLFSGALELVNQKQHDKAVAALERVASEAVQAGHVALARVAKNYLTALQVHSQPKADIKASPELEAQVLLNRGDWDQALALLEKALGGKAQDARLLYLKATALALKEDAPGSAEALKQAVALNPDLVHQFRLEKDFDRVRSAAPFVSAGLD